MDKQEESSFSRYSHSPTHSAEEHQPPSNLKRFHGATGLLEFVHRSRSSHDNKEEPYLEADDARFFDSRDYRCCCSIFHAKIGTFVFCTWIFHEIVLGTIYLLTQLENGGELTSRMALLLACRFIQLPAIAILYVGLWRHQRYLLLPFALVQITLGTFVDMSTLMMLVEHLDASGSSMLPFNHNTRWLNVVLPLLFYTAIQVGLIWVLYKCFVFLKARSAHDEKRRLEKQKEQTKLRNMSSSCGQPLLIQRSLSDREPVASYLLHRGSNTAPKASTSPPETVTFRANEGGEQRTSSPPSRNSSPPALVMISSQNAP